MQTVPKKAHKIEEFIIKKCFSTTHGKIIYVVMDACDYNGNATQGGGAVREFCDTWAEAINFTKPYLGAP